VKVRAAFERPAAVASPFAPDHQTYFAESI
jgi:hypothetical protein